MLPTLEEMVNLNVDMIGQMSTCASDVGNEELNSMCESTTDLIDDIIAIYTEQGRQMQVDNFKALKAKLELQKVPNRIIRVV